MKQALQQISTPIAPHIEAFKEAYQAALQSNNALLEQMVAHVNQSLGKQMRPMLVLLCAQLCGGITPATIHAAVSVELLHVASLIHDDVVDESDQRRGKPSLWARFQSKAAVLGGDFYLSAALSEAVKSNQLAIVEGIANMGKRLVDGELLQLSGSKNAIYNQAYYFKVIEAKTAELFKTCAQLGALSSPNCSEQLVEKAIEMGNAIGICFQLKDDVFDYQQGEHIGKPVGNDVQEGKMTLPLLYVYEQASESEKATIKQAFDNKDVAYIQQLVSEKGGIDYTLEQIELYKQKALQYLQDFEDSPTRKAIEQFILLVAEREK
jgi:octaprenyl-diphosphate synthase